MFSAVSVAPFSSMCTVKPLCHQARRNPNPAYTHRRDIDQTHVVKVSVPIMIQQWHHGSGITSSVYDMAFLQLSAGLGFPPLMFAWPGLTTENKRYALYLPRTRVSLKHISTAITWYVT